MQANPNNEAARELVRSKRLLDTMDHMRRTIEILVLHSGAGRIEIDPRKVEELMKTYNRCCLEMAAPSFEREHYTVALADLNRREEPPAKKINTGCVFQDKDELIARYRVVAEPAETGAQIDNDDDEESAPEETQAAVEPAETGAQIDNDDDDEAPEETQAAAEPGETEAGEQ